MHGSKGGIAPDLYAHGADQFLEFEIAASAVNRLHGILGQKFGRSTEELGIRDYKALEGSLLLRNEPESGSLRIEEHDIFSPGGRRNVEADVPLRIDRGMVYVGFKVNLIGLRERMSLP